MLAIFHCICVDVLCLILRVKCLFQKVETEITFLTVCKFQFCRYIFIKLINHSYKKYRKKSKSTFNLTTVFYGAG